MPYLIVAIAAGGALGAVSRHILGAAIMRAVGASFPYGTLAVNVLGCFLMGLLVSLLTYRLQLSMEWRGFLTVGLLGGFTTFSTFSLEGVLLFERGEHVAAAGYLAASVALGIGAVLAGMLLGKMGGV